MIGLITVLFVIVDIAICFGVYEECDTLLEDFSGRCIELGGVAVINAVCCCGNLMV